MKKNPTPDAAPAKRAARGESKKIPAKPTVVMQKPDKLVAQVISKTIAVKKVVTQNNSTAVAIPQTAAAKTETKARRTRVPADLAAQYGEKVNSKAQERAVVSDAPKARRPRRNAADKAKLQELLRPDDDILARLARANSIGATKKRAPSRRSKTWKARCGRCGTACECAVPAALCTKCGAILMRVEE